MVIWVVFCKDSCPPENDRRQRKNDSKETHIPIPQNQKEKESW